MRGDTPDAGVYTARIASQAAIAEATMMRITLRVTISDSNIIGGIY